MDVETNERTVSQQRSGCETGKAEHALIPRLQ
jgi:hypothetical protein